MKWNVLTHTSEPSNYVVMVWKAPAELQVIRVGIYINDAFYPMGETGMSKKIFDVM